jgi:hypothetical protein
MLAASGSTTAIPAPELRSAATAAATIAEPQASGTARNIPLRTKVRRWPAGCATAATS